jgi:putative phosphoribosyl transferase
VFMIPTKIAEKFKDRLEVGELLTRRLSAYYRHENAVVVALPRGGVPIGHIIADRFQIPLDILMVHKLSLPGNEEYAIGALSSDGTCILREDAINVLDISNQAIEAAAQRELHELERRERLYRKGRRAQNLKGRVVILVDDGVATGATMEVAAHVIRKEKPERLIIAVPVATPEVCRKLRSNADEIVCLQMPERFCAVGEWYLNFEQTSDDEVASMLEIGNIMSPRKIDGENSTTRKFR